MAAIGGEQDTPVQDGLDGHPLCADEAPIDDHLGSALDLRGLVVGYPFEEADLAAVVAGDLEHGEYPVRAVVVHKDQVCAVWVVDITG